MMSRTGLLDGLSAPENKRARTHGVVEESNSASRVLFNLHRWGMKMASAGTLLGKETGVANYSSVLKKSYMRALDKRQMGRDNDGCLEAKLGLEGNVESETSLESLWLCQAMPPNVPIGLGH